MVTPYRDPSIDEYLRKRLTPVEGAIPHLPGIEMYGNSIPAGTVGGDLFEYIELCEDIFAEQLAGWFNDTTAWPADRSFDVFCRWFDYQHHSMLIDLCDEPLIRERD